MECNSFRSFWGRPAQPDLPIQAPVGKWAHPLHQLSTAREYHTRLTGSSPWGQGLRHGAGGAPLPRPQATVAGLLTPQAQVPGLDRLRLCRGPCDLQEVFPGCFSPHVGTGGGFCGITKTHGFCMRTICCFHLFSLMVYLQKVLFAAP